jgi:hypothetical protein
VILKVEDRLSSSTWRALFAPLSSSGPCDDELDATLAGFWKDG